jgi:ubiquinone/menaquinone biosynthesis C-methylase UbiE
MLQATEKRSFEQALEGFPKFMKTAQTLMNRLDEIAPIPQNGAILDVGSAQGLMLIACAKMGWRAIGIEPWEQARENAAQLADHFGVDITLVEGRAEALPVESNSFDIVHANSVIEHVEDADAAFREAYRVLKPGGVFWFYTASSMCPQQNEIRGFPAFGWYPDPLKQRIMNWAKRARPELIGHTERPAIHWFTPWKASRMLRDVGFRCVYDRWDLRLPSEGGKVHGFGLKLIKRSRALRLITDVAFPDCAYAAVK